VGPTPNQSGPMDEQRGMILHVMQGSLAGSVAWAKNPASQVSFHFGTSKAGECQQLIDTDVTAWTQGDGNGSWVSVENEDFSGNPLNAAQLENVAQLYARGVREYGWPYQLANSPSGFGLGWHGMGGVAWGNHPDCPGQPIIDQRTAILSRAFDINNGSSEDDMGASFGPLEILPDTTSLCIPPVSAGAADPRPAWLNICNDTFGQDYALRIFGSKGDQTWQPVIGAGVVVVKSGERVSMQLATGVAAVSIKRQPVEGVVYDGPLTCCFERGQVGQ
jgi:hypothetical protein